jgi:hypothetical protein
MNTDRLESARTSFIYKRDEDGYTNGYRPLLETEYLAMLEEAVAIIEEREYQGCGGVRLNSKRAMDALRQLYTEDGDKCTQFKSYCSKRRNTVAGWTKVALEMAQDIADFWEKTHIAGIERIFDRTVCRV